MTKYLISILLALIVLELALIKHCHVEQKTVESDLGFPIIVNVQVCNNLFQDMEVCS